MNKIPNCQCSEMNENNVTINAITKHEKLRITSKYFLGSTTVQVVYLSGSNESWTPSGKLSFRKNIIDSGINMLNNVFLSGSPSIKLPAHSFKVVETESYSPYNIPLGKYDNTQLARNVKKYLKDGGYFNGNTDTYGNNVWNEDLDMLQSLYDRLNDLREENKTDWSIIVLACANSKAINTRAWASEKLGFSVLHEKDTNGDWTFVHELFHLYGALDEYGDPSSCANWLGGMYELPNKNCERPPSSNCVMRYSNKLEICQSSWDQLSLMKETDGSYKAENDYSYNSYVLGDNFFKKQWGVILTGDVIRANQSLYIQVEGKSKMHPWYNQHGPDGDKNTIVGNDHMLPNYPFSAVIGRWISLDGLKSSNWFYVGSGKRWFKAPNYNAFFVWGINDRKGDFNDNSGNMTVKIWARLKNQCGPVWKWKMTQASDLETIEALETNINNYDIPEMSSENVF